MFTLSHHPQSHLPLIHLCDFTRHFTQMRVVSPPHFLLVLSHTLSSSPMWLLLKYFIGKPPTLENLAQHIFMSPGGAYSLLPETNGLKVKSRTERWRLNTGLQILKSKVLGVYAYTYPLHLKVVLLLLFWGQKKKNWRHINNNSASHLGSKSVNSKWQWASCCMMCALGFVCVARVGISKGQTNSAEVHGHS